jgi:ABC-type dipeptide/oligopeptide/nickel transport systems, permease components
MLRFIVRRLVFIVITATFFMMKVAPGGPLDNEKATTKEIRERLEEYYGLNKPILQQYVKFLKGLSRGELGPSFKYQGWNVDELIADAFPVSLELACYALAFALTAGLLAGIIASLKPNSLRDYIPMAIATFGICLPTFVTGPLLILCFGILLGWYNSSGWFFASDRVLPAITLGFYYVAHIARLARGGMLEVLGQDFIRTARAKGASEGRVVLKHALRGGLLSVVSFLGPAITGLVTGSLVVETIFQIPGLGRFFVKAGLNRDYTMLMGTVLFYAFLIMVMNLIVDIIQVWLNPRLRFD